MLLGWRAIKKRTFDFYECPQCHHRQESVSYGEDELASCYGCNEKMPVETFGMAKVKRSAAICAKCGESVPVLNESMMGPYYACANCDNLVAVSYGNHCVVSPEQVLRLDWRPEIVARSEALGIWRWAVCLTKKDHLVARILFWLASEEDGSFIYGLESEHHTMLALNDEGYLGYLFWTDSRSRSSGKREPVLRQVFVRKEFRRQGVGTMMVEMWADRFAFPLAPKFGVESPNAHTKRMLVRLGYAHIDGQKSVGTRCGFIQGL